MKKLLLIPLLFFSSATSVGQEAATGEIGSWQTKSVPLRISEETTYITEPLTADGSMVDYGLYLEQRFAPKNPEDNGFREVVQAFGREQIGSKLGTPPKGAITDEYWTFLCERLRLDPQAAPTIRFQHALQAVRASLKAREGNQDDSRAVFELHERLVAAPWTGSEFPVIEQWINESEPYFALFSEALTKPGYFTAYYHSKPGAVGQESTLATIQVHRNFLRDLVIRTNYFIGMERYEDAWRDIQTLFRLSRAFHRMPSLIAYLTSVAFEQMAQRTIVRLIVHGKINAEQWKRFAEDFDILVPPDSYGIPLTTMRFEDLATLSTYANCRDETVLKKNAVPLDAKDYDPQRFSRGKVWTILLECDGVDWNIMAQAINACYDVMQKKDVPKEFDFDAYQTVLAEASKSIADWQAMDVAERSRRLGLLYGYDALSTVHSFRATRLQKAQSDRIRLGLALGRFKAKTGRYPEKLEELVEQKFVAEIPFDATLSANSPVPFGYRLLPPDGYVLDGFDSN